jgi:curved DNA-binding protein CbpA
MVVAAKLYELLGVKPDASEQDLKRTFKRKAQLLHLDKNPDDLQAIEILKDQEK